MSDLSDLERRVEELEQRADQAKSLKWTMLIVMLGLLGVVLMQTKINSYFKGKFNALDGINVRATSDEK